MLVIVSIFYIPKVFPKEIFNVFLQDVSLLLGLCFDSEEMRLGFTKNVRELFYIDPQSYTDKMHGLCRLASGVKKISLVFCS